METFPCQQSGVRRICITKPSTMKVKRTQKNVDLNVNLLLGKYNTDLIVIKKKLISQITFKMPEQKIHN